ncbi:outer membrane beta-barrel family protein [Zhouia amylolytica]|uniref:Outer membrane receptor protein n=1 Tax=Zhouia amylolytica AD3 TaxID=1286632 RepID=W2UMK1_9FLAO|nr:outer membrane beta-barrel family protein [Zhouia amylolytica]ETN95370.1 outer membrane receptor protein [Zhouia amylolytica AD3]
MKFKLFAFCVIIIGLFTAEAQSPIAKKIRLTGQVIDADTNEPLEYATIVLQSVKNPNNVTGGITDAEGKFNVEANSGVYNIRVEFISYGTYEIKNQNLTKNKDLGVIKLSLDVAQLEAVEVVSERTTVEVRLDKKIYNIGKDLTTSGGTVSEALNNVPSVTVDIDGAISLRGNENVRILINGKPSAMAGFGSTEALRQLPADAIEKVEVITSPSARYDAEGTAGILNIVLKKEKTLGVNGSANLTMGYPNSSQITTNFNYRTDKFNIFNTLGYFYREPPGNGFFDNRYEDGKFDRIIEDRDMSRKDKGFNMNIGMEYFINDQSSITGSFFTRLSDEQDVTENKTERFINSVVDSRTNRKEEENEDDTNYQVSLSYINKFNDEGHQLTADLQYSFDDEDVLSNIIENATYPNNSLIASENIYEIETQKDYLIQADYVLPMGEAQFEAGYRGDFEKEQNEYRLDTLDRNSNEYITNNDLSNIFDYTENVHALYTQYGNKFGKFSFLLGLRLENTQLIGKVKTLDGTPVDNIPGINVEANFDKNYLGLFPTVNLIYELNEYENISIGYNRRINRPRGWFINPFPSRSSRTNVFQGNPDLDPAYANAFDVGYLKRWEKITFNTSVYYQRETNAFERIQEETGETTSDGIEIIRSIPINLATNQRVGFEGSLMYNPSRKLRFNGSFNYFHFDSDGEFNGIDYGTKSSSWFARFSSKVTLPGKIDWQTNAFYMGPRENSQTKSEGMFSLDLAFSKDILNDNATISFNVRDLLNSRKRQSFTESYDANGNLRFTSESEFQWRERQFNISFIYRFNQPKERNGRGGGNNRNGGGEDMDFEG